MSKKPIKIELGKEEDATVYYEKILGRNKTIRRRAAVIYYASQGAESITELSSKCEYDRVFVSRTLKGYAEKGMAYIYECSRGIKKSILDTIEDELLADFEKNPPSSIPEAVSRIKEKYGITITDTPVRYWLKKRASLPQIKTSTSKSKSECTAVFSGKCSYSSVGYGSKPPYKGIFL